MNMNGSIVTWGAAIVGVALIAAGVIGLLGDNALVGSPDGEPVFVAGWVHDIVHLGTGALALVIAFGMRGASQAYALIGFGVVYAAILVLTLISADLFGILVHPVNVGDHLLHIVLAAIGIGLGWYGLNQGRRVTA